MDPNDFVCAICRDLAYCVVVLECKHFYCYSCIEQSSMCPYCTREIKSKLIIDRALDNKIRALFPKEIAKRCKDDTIDRYAEIYKKNIERFNIYNEMKRLFDQKQEELFMIVNYFTIEYISEVISNEYGYPYLLVLINIDHYGKIMWRYKNAIFNVDPNIDLDGFDLCNVVCKYEDIDPLYFRDDIRTVLESFNKINSEEIMYNYVRDNIDNESFINELQLSIQTDLKNFPINNSTEPHHTFEINRFFNDLAFQVSNNMMFGYITIIIVLLLVCPIMSIYVTGMMVGTLCMMIFEIVNRNTNRYFISIISLCLLSIFYVTIL